MTLPLAGAKIRAADLAAIFPQNTDAWTAYTPTLTQGATITKTVNRAAYTKVGRTVTVSVFMTATSAGTAGQVLILGLPVAPAADLQIGVCYITDTSVPTRYVCTVLTSGGALLVQANQAGGSGHFGVNPAVTIASGDQITFAITYEAAS